MKGQSSCSSLASKSINNSRISSITSSGLASGLSILLIHTITERYQLRTQRPDGYAEETDRYADLNSAINEFIKDMNMTIEGLENTRSIDNYV